MKIILPPHSKISEPVKSWAEIKADAEAMRADLTAGTYLAGNDKRQPELWRGVFAVAANRPPRTAVSYKV